DRNNRQGIPATQRLGAPGVGVISNSVAASYDGRVRDLIGEADTWRKELLAKTHSSISRDRAPATDQDFVGSGIIRLNAHAGGPRPSGVKLPSQTEIQSQLGGGAPAVANVESK